LKTILSSSEVLPFPNFSEPTNEKEMLEIVWALDNLRSYLYGAGSIKIYTDHRPLTFVLGNRNFNAKLKRWKSRIEEYNCEQLYKPGKANIVADGLSRVASYVNHLGSDTDTAFESDSIATVHSALQNASCLIPHVETPINAYRNQLIFYLFRVGTHMLDMCATQFQ